MKRLHEIIGVIGEKKIINTELISKMNARRSIVINKDLKKGTKIKRTDLSFKRPGTGIKPINLNKLF